MKTNAWLLLNLIRKLLKEWRRNWKKRLKEGKNSAEEDRFMKTWTLALLMRGTGFIMLNCRGASRNMPQKSKIIWTEERLRKFVYFYQIFYILYINHFILDKQLVIV